MMDTLPSMRLSDGYSYTRERIFNRKFGASVPLDGMERAVVKAFVDALTAKSDADVGEFISSKVTARGLFELEKLRAPLYQCSYKLLDTPAAERDSSAVKKNSAIVFGVMSEEIGEIEDVVFGIYTIRENGAWKVCAIDRESVSEFL